jgi:hypothetical protein
MQGKPIFIHSLFRSGSTYIFEVFRRTGAYYCYQEPFNEFLLNVKNNPEILLEKISEKKFRHPSLNKPYFQEYYRVARSIAPFFNKSICYDQYFTNQYEESSDFRSYLDMLINAAHARPVLQFCRSSGRIEAIKSHFDGVHIYLYRNPWDQWWSYQTNHCFDRSNIFIARCDNAPAYVSDVFKLLRIAPFYSEDFWEETVYLDQFRLSARESYMLFYVLWCHAMLSALPLCDIEISIDLLSVSGDYRKDILRQINDISIGNLDFSDCHIPLAAYKSDEQSFFIDVERQVHEILLSHGVPELHLSSLAQYSYQELISRYKITPDNNAPYSLARQQDISRRLIDEQVRLSQQNQRLTTSLHDAESSARKTGKEAEARASQAEEKASQAEEKASQAEEKASQAEDKASQAEDKASQAEDKASQAEEKASQAEDKASQAEAQANIYKEQIHQLEAQIWHEREVLQGIFNSRSWKLTKPVRWIGEQVKLLKKHGVVSRGRMFAAKSRRALFLKKKLLVSTPFTIGQKADAVPESIKHLNPHARRVHAKLQSSILKDTRKDS